MSSEKKDYIPEFDGLRALAALAVVLGHTTGGASILKLVKTPGQAVTFFFVLSGFLITGILLGMRNRVETKTSRPGAELRIFYCRRALRIFPPFYAFLLFFLIIGTPFIVDTFWWHAAYLSNFYPAFHEPLAYPLPHFWTLAVEEQFYLLWPFIVMFVPARSLKPVLLAIISMAVVYRCFTANGSLTMHPARLSTFAHLDALGMGSLLAVLMRENTEQSERRVRQLRWLGLWVGLPGLLLGLLLALPDGGFPYFHGTFGKLGMALFAVFILIRFSTPSDTLAARTLRSGPLRFLGQISYGIYIYHYPFIHLSKGLAKQSELLSSPAARFAFVLVCTLLTATASWFIMERPLLSLKKFVRYNASTTKPDLRAKQLVTAAE
ncbi:MAG: acyltransferase [Verrucomicrobiaceae bacterium]|nr:MAG: acyltransferase [Verrucomicrobiaceae bacterium]